MSRSLLAITAGLALVLTACGSGEVFSLDVGDCFDDPDGEDRTVGSVPDIDCDQLHDNEVFATFELVGATWPGTDQVAEDAEDGCLERFEGFVGTTYLESELSASAFWPSEDSWEAGDREVICFVYDPDGPVTATLEGADR